MSQNSKTISVAGNGTTLQTNLNNVFDTLASNFSGPTAPTYPIAGQTWYDTSTLITKQYNGTVWKSIYEIEDTTESTSTTTGALIVAGGVGIASDTYIGGKLNLTDNTAENVEGDIWKDSTQKTLSTFINGINQKVTGVIWSKTATTTLASWTTAASIIGASGTGVGTLTLPANSLVPGKTIRFRLKGVLGTYSTAPTLNMLISLGGVAIGSTGAVAMTTASMSGRAWALDFEFTCRTAGASGTVVTDGLFTFCNSATLSYCWGLGLGTTTATINTTQANAIDVQAACGTSNAANTISCTIASIEVLN